MWSWPAPAEPALRRRSWLTTKAPRSSCWNAQTRSAGRRPCREEEYGSPSTTTWARWTRRIPERRRWPTASGSRQARRPTSWWRRSSTWDIRSSATWKSARRSSSKRPPRLTIARRRRGQSSAVERSSARCSRRRSSASGRISSGLRRSCSCRSPSMRRCGVWPSLGRYRRASSSSGWSRGWWPPGTRSSAGS